MNNHTAHVLPFTTLAVHKDAVNETARRIEKNRTFRRKRDEFGRKTDRIYE